MHLSRYSLIIFLTFSVLPAFSLQAGKEVTVYILDNGIREDHEHFEDVDIESVDMVKDFANWGDIQISRPIDSEAFAHGDYLESSDQFGDHATLIAGLVVDRSPDVNLVSVRALNEQGRGTWASFIRGVHWITNNHTPGEPAIVNLSLGGVPDSRIGELITKAINNLKDKGITIIAAAGNTGEYNPGRVPSVLKSVISVGAVSFFNYRLTESNYGDYVDVYASGENLKGPGSRSTSKRIRDSGTSYAAAVVTGHVAAYLKEHPAASPEEVKAWVKSNSVQGKVKNLPRDHVGSALLFKLR